MAFFDWWASLSGWVRYPVAVLIMVGSTVGFVHNYTLHWGAGRLWAFGWAIGFILLFYGPSRADRRGYHL